MRLQVRFSVLHALAGGWDLLWFEFSILLGLGLVWNSDFFQIEPLLGLALGLACLVLGKRSNGLGPIELTKFVRLLFHVA